MQLLVFRWVVSADAVFADMSSQFLGLGFLGFTAHFLDSQSSTSRSIDSAWTCMIKTSDSIAIVADDEMP